MKYLHTDLNLETVITDLLTKSLKNDDEESLNVAIDITLADYEDYDYMSDIFRKIFHEDKNVDDTLHHWSYILRFEKRRQLVD